MLSIRLEIEQKFARLAAKSGRTKSSLAREAIAEYVGDLEDFHIAEARSRRNRTAIPIAEIGVQCD